MYGIQPQYREFPRPVFNAVQSRFCTNFGDGSAHGVLNIPEAICGSCEVRDQFNKEYIYQALFQSGKLVDVNAPETLGRHLSFLKTAQGRILVGNAGLGGFLYRLIRKPGVVHITVAEPNFDILELVEPAFSKFVDKVTFVSGTIQDILAEESFDFVYPNETW